MDVSGVVRINVRGSINKTSLMRLESGSGGYSASAEVTISEILPDNFPALIQLRKTEREVALFSFQFDDDVPSSNYWANSEVIWEWRRANA